MGSKNVFKGLFLSSELMNDLVRSSEVLSTTVDDVIREAIEMYTEIVLDDYEHKVELHGNQRVEVKPRNVVYVDGVLDEEWL